MPDSDYSGIIDQLAEQLGVSLAARKKWRQRGVPYYRREEIRELATQRRITIPREAFDNFGRAEAA